MKKTITFIMALVLAATVLCGCNDKSDTDSSAGEEKVTTTSESKETQPESSSVTDSTDTSQPTVTEQPETSEEPEAPDKPSVPDFEDEEVVKQLANEQLETIKNKDFDKYIGLCNINLIEQYVDDTNIDIGETDLSNFLQEYCQSLDLYYWSDLNISEIDIIECDSYGTSPYKVYEYEICWNDGIYTDASFIIISNGQNYSTILGDIESRAFKEKDAVKTNSKAKIIFLELYQFCEEQMGYGNDSLSKLAGSYYIGKNEVYNNDIMTEFIEYFKERNNDYEEYDGLLYIEISPNGFPSLVQWASRSEFRRSVGQYPNPSEIGDVDFLGSDPN